MILPYLSARLLSFFIFFCCIFACFWSLRLPNILKHRILCNKGCPKINVLFWMYPLIQATQISYTYLLICKGLLNTVPKGSITLLNDYWFLSYNSKQNVPKPTWNLTCIDLSYWVLIWPPKQTFCCGYMLLLT